MSGMTRHILPTRPLTPGDKVAVLSPAWAAPAYFPHVHEHALERIRTLLGVEPVEFPTTRQMGATPQQRANDINAAFADPTIRAIMTPVGGDDQITVTRYLDPALPAADPKPFFGYSDNTNILNWLWTNGVAGYHGGATMVHLGAAQVDDLHIATLKAALFGGGDYILDMPTHSEDHGLDWADPTVLTVPAEREPAAPVEFIGPNRAVRGTTWGGCLEVLDQLAWADRLPTPSDLEGAILLWETSEILPPPDYIGRWVRAMGERGYLDTAAGVAFAQPVVTNRERHSDTPTRNALREAHIDYVLSNIARYRSDLLVCVNLPFGHTRPQAVLPYGGQITLDPIAHQVTAHYTNSEDVGQSRSAGGCRPLE